MTRDDSLFGRWLSQHRRLADLTQADLAREIGCSEITIRKIEAGLRTPSRQIAARLAVCLAIPDTHRATFIAFARGRVLDVSTLEGHSGPEQAALIGLAPSAAQPGSASLPTPITRLIGRDADVAALLRMLEGNARLLTLTGPPGIGKTRLGLHVAAEARHRFADDAAFVPLATVTKHGQVLNAIAEALCVEERSSTPADRLLEHLRGRHLLLVLDNVEHVLEAAPELAELLARCSGLTIIATSQAALHIRGERRYPVGPLALPEPHSPAEKIAHSPAVMLFVERAQEVAPHFTLDDEQAGLVAEICARVDGLPLAIELVAARCDLLAPQALLARLGRRLALLIEGACDLPPRQRALRSAIDWSYDLLGPAQRLVFERLGVFTGTFDLEAAQAVCAGQSGVEAALADLVHRSLVQVKPGSTTRYSMLETIREYALERLGASSPEARSRHAAHFAALVAACADSTVNTIAEPALQRLTADEHNLRAALEWLMATEPEAAMRCAMVLRHYWMARGLLIEGRGWLERGLALEPDARTATRARALAAAGFLAFQQGDHRDAEALASASLGLYCDLRDRAGAADALLTLGRATLQQSRFAEAERWLREALAHWQEIGGIGGAAEALRALAIGAKDQGNLEEAAELCRASLELYQQTGEQRGEARVLYNLSTIAYWQGEYTQAGALAEQAAAIFRALDDQMGLAYAIEGSGIVAYRRGQHHEARQALLTSLTMLRTLDDRGGVALTLHELGLVAAALGDAAEAARLQLQGLALAWRIGDLRRAAFCLEGLGASLAVERPTEAARLLGAAMALREELGAPLLGLDQERFERCVSSVCACAPATFEAAWAEGALSPEALIVALIDERHRRGGVSRQAPIESEAALEWGKRSAHRGEGDPRPPGDHIA